MKNIYRLFATALVLLGAAACNPSEINTPDNPDTPVTPEQPGKSVLTITASIPKTRVSYFDSPSDDDLHQAWETNDVLFGFYGDNPANQIVFTVSSVDSQTGVAVLKPEVGEEWILSATDGDVYLIYTGLNTGGDVSYNYENLLFSKNSFDVYTASQTGGRIPACMHAHAELQIDGEGNKSLEFIFQNDCAIIELAGLTGIKEDYSIPEEAVLSKISVTGLFLDGKYSYDEEHNVLTFGANGNKSKTVEIDFGDNSQWKVDETGNISGPEKILIAVVPKDDFTDITVNAKVSGTENAFNYTYLNKKISYTNCYVIAPADVVAKTADGQYFKTVKEAFAHAKDLFAQLAYNTTEKNIVTLVRDCGLAGIDTSKDPIVGVSAPISIVGYDVTLDLNGHTLFLGDNDENSEQFIVKKNCIFSIKDSKGKLNDDTGMYFGKIDSNAFAYVIDNEGKVNIFGGSLINNSGENYNDGYGVIGNDGTVDIYDGYLFAKTYCSVANDGSLNVYEGTLVADVYNTVNNNGTLNVGIDGGNCKITSTNYSAVVNTSTVNITGGVITAKSQAIYSQGGEVNIGDESPSVQYPITISSTTTDDSTLGNAAIVIMAKGKLNVYYGDVQNLNNSAVYLDGANDVANIYGGHFQSKGDPLATVHINPDASCNIYGGYFESTANEGQTIYMAGTSSSKSSCIISGGIIKSVDGYGFAFNAGPSSTASVYGNSLFYCKVPVCSAKNNYGCSVTITGGYLYSTSSENAVFFTDDSDDMLSKCEAFYSNTYYYYARKENKNTTYSYGSYSRTLNSSEKIFLGLFVDNLAFPYMITGKYGESSMSAGGTQNYTFGNFGW